MILRLALLSLMALSTARAAEVAEVRAVQQALRDRKLFFGDVDGVPGRAFRDAVREFQAAAGLDATGTLNAETMAVLGVKAILDAKERERQEVYKCLQRYLECREKGTLEQEMGWYAGMVEYFEDGLVDARFVRDARRAERDRWPERKLVLLNRIASPLDAARSGWLVTCRYRLSVKSGEETPAAIVADEEIVLERRESGWRIVAIRAAQAGRDRESSQAK